MDFARKQLEKYGWTIGKGLGKHENGISEALKPKLKRSVTGIGHDAASDFTEHWWTALYDKAAGNVQLEEKNGRTKKIKTKESFEITNSTWKLKKKKKDDEPEEQYQDYFVRTAVLSNEGLKREREDSDDEGATEKKDVFKMTDEELFAACEGRTAHKGARHGLRALGKLARIEQQEKMLLSQPQYNGYSHAKKIKEKTEVVEDLNLNSDVDANENTKKKKKKRKRCVSNENKPEAEIQESTPENNEVKMTDADNVASDSQETTNSVENDCDDDEIPIEDIIDFIKPKKKKKRKQLENDVVMENESIVNGEQEEMSTESKVTESKKKKKLKQTE